MSPTRPTQTEQLQAALACLDLSLESELGLYRRQTLQAVSSLALPEAETPVNPDEVALAPESTPILSPQAQANPPQPAPNAPQPVLNTTQTDLASKQSLPGLADAAVQPDRLNAIGPETSVPPQRSPYAAPLDEDPEKLPEPYSPETVAQPEALERFLDPSIEDYLESSEALLKHLDRSETRHTPKENKPLSRTSKLPFKVLGAVLMLALLAGLGAFLLKQFSRLGPQSVPQTVSPVTPTSDAISPAITNPSPAATSGSSQTLSPNPSSPSASQSVPIGLSPSPIVSTTPLAQPSSSTVPTTQSATPASPLVTPTSSPQATPSAALPSAAFYVVVAPYEGDASYERAKQLVPDAFIANVKGKKQIQLSFLEELSRAQRLVNDLKNQGFSASIVAQN